MEQLTEEDRQAIIKYWATLKAHIKVTPNYIEQIAKGLQQSEVELANLENEHPFLKELNQKFN